MMHEEVLPEQQLSCHGIPDAQCMHDVLCVYRSALAAARNQRQELCDVLRCRASGGLCGCPALKQRGQGHRPQRLLPTSRHMDQSVHVCAQ